jgi:hypothetical protein
MLGTVVDLNMYLLNPVVNLATLRDVTFASLHDNHGVDFGSGRSVLTS